MNAIQTNVLLCKCKICYNTLKINNFFLYSDLIKWKGGA